MKLFRGTRQIVSYEDVEVLAANYDEAMEKFEIDTEDVKVTGERDGDYEVVGKLIEVNGPLGQSSPRLRGGSGAHQRD